MPLKQLEEYKNTIEAALGTLFNEPDAVYARLLESMRYSLTSGGKRLRPALTLEFCRISGAEPEAALPAACAVEMLHTYTLIHDDLPCMDDDDLRRGRPTNHIVYGEMIATLAGDALQAEAFKIILTSELPDKAKLACAAILAEAAGASGVCGGQLLDMEYEGVKIGESELLEVHSRKTSALFSAACRMGVSAACGGDEKLRAAHEFAQELGLAFQIRDDMLDAIGRESELGKPTGSDVLSGKTTFMSLFGSQKCAELVREHSTRAKNALEGIFDDTDFLFAIVDEMALRTK